MEAATVTLLILLLNCLTGSSSLQCSTDEYQSGENCCLKCDIGSGLRVKTWCTRTSDSVCEPLEGFYCVDSSEGKCAAAKKHSSCQAGQYISKHGSLYEDTECSECSDGSFSTTGSSSWCQPHTQCSFFNPLLIRPGNSTADAQCGIVFSGLDKVIVAVIGMLLVMVAIVEIGLFFYWLYRKRKLSEEENEKIKTDPNELLIQHGLMSSPTTSMLTLIRLKRTTVTKEKNCWETWKHPRLESHQWIHEYYRSKSRGQTKSDPTMYHSM